MIVESTFIPLDRIGIITTEGSSHNSERESTLLNTSQIINSMAHEVSNEIPLPQLDGSLIAREFTSITRECLPIRINFSGKVSTEALQLATDFFTLVDANKICVEISESGLSQPESEDKHVFIHIKCEVDQLKTVTKLLQSVLNVNDRLIEHIEALVQENNQDSKAYRLLATHAIEKLNELRPGLSEEKLVELIKRHELSHLTRHKILSGVKINIDEIEADDLFKSLQTSRVDALRLDESISILHELFGLAVEDNHLSEESKYYFFKRMAIFFSLLSEKSFRVSTDEDREDLLNPPSNTLENTSRKQFDQLDRQSLAWLQILLGTTQNPIDVLKKAPDETKQLLLEKANLALSDPQSLFNTLNPNLLYDNLLNAFTNVAHEFQQQFANIHSVGELSLAQST